MRALTQTLTAVTFVSLSGLVHAVTPVDAVGTQIIIPVAASTASFRSQVFVFNPNDDQLTVAIKYIGGTTTLLPGPRDCAGATIGPSQTAVIDVTVQCALPPAQNHFGTLRISDDTPENLPFTAYSRVQTPQGIGFSLEGVPVGNFSLSHVIAGLRSGGSPLYQSNCFVGTFEETVDYQIQLADGNTGLNLPGSILIAGTLPANSLLRILDIFTAAGLAGATSPTPGTYTNVNAYINENTTGAPAIIAFCTVQENTNFSADYRIGKSAIPFDSSRERDSTTFRSRLDENFTVNAGSQSNLHEIYFRAPDLVACELVGTPPILGGNPADVANLEMRLLNQSTSLADTQVANPPGHVLEGGNNKNSFPKVPLGSRGTATATSFDGIGVNGRWLIQVEGNETSAGPKTYGIRCTSGNGHTRPALIKTLGADVF